jgi:hypothetical protein
MPYPLFNTKGLTVKAIEDNVGGLSDFMAEAMGRRRRER